MKPLHLALILLSSAACQPCWAEGPPAPAATVLMAVGGAEAGAPPSVMQVGDGNRHELLDAQMLRLTAATPMALRAVVKDVPYSAEVVSETVQLLADGNRITSRNVSRQYRDSAGRTRRETELVNSGESTVQITDPVAMQAYLLRPGEKRGVQMALTPAASRKAAAAGTDAITIKFDKPQGSDAASAGRNVGAALAPLIYNAAGDAKWIQQAVRKDLGLRDFDGVSARGTAITYEIPAGEVGNAKPIVVASESWYAPELRLVIYSRSVDPRMPERTMRYTNIRRAEVPPSTFAIPADYSITDLSAK